MVLSYLALTVTNNSGLQLENMWLAYTPMFVGVYVFSRWIDSKLGSPAAPPAQPDKKADDKGSPNAETTLRASNATVFESLKYQLFR